MQPLTKLLGHSSIGQHIARVPEAKLQQPVGKGTCVPISCDILFIADSEALQEMQCKLQHAQSWPPSSRNPLHKVLVESLDRNPYKHGEVSNPNAPICAYSIRASHPSLLLAPAVNEPDVRLRANGKDAQFSDPGSKNESFFGVNGLTIFSGEATKQKGQ